MATQRILDFLATRRPSGPCLVVDLDVVRENFRAFEKALPDSKIYYAVKANPHREVLSALAAHVDGFDLASEGELDAVVREARGRALSIAGPAKTEALLARGVELDAVVNLESLRELELVRREVSVPLIASGGAGRIGDFVPAVQAGADAVLAASVFHFGTLRIDEVKAELASAGYPVR